MKVLGHKTDNQVKSCMLSLGFDNDTAIDSTIRRMNERQALGGNVLRDAIAYGIASIL